MNEVEEIKRRIDIFDLVSQYLTLKKTGQNWRANCPFHQEKTPSFMVNPERQIFKCFGCGRGGDVFTFIMEMERMNFPEALEFLANKAGVILEKHRKKDIEQYKKEKDAKSRIYKINQLSALAFQKILLESSAGKIAFEYLKKRGLKLETVKENLLGFAPEKPFLRDFLDKRGFSDSEIKLAGNPAMFRNRIVFPIKDVMGNVVGFTGRILDKGEPKYLNTPETPIFHKSSILYGLDLAKQDIKIKNQAIIVEGQIDVLASCQASVSETVASSGTALTRDHLAILARYTSNIIFAFDNDAAGFETAKKAIVLAYELDLIPRLVLFPKDIKDPGELAISKPEEWRELVKNAEPAIEWLTEKFLDGETELDVLDKKRIARELIPFLGLVGDPIERDYWIKFLAKKLKTEESAVREALRRAKNFKFVPQTMAQKEKQKLTLEESFLSLIINHLEDLGHFINHLDYRDFVLDSPAQKIYKAIETCYTQSEDTKDRPVFLQCVEKNFSPQEKQFLDFLILEGQVLHKEKDKEKILLEAEETITRLKEKRKEEVKKNFAEKIKEAESASNRGEVKKLLVELQKLMSK